jgi:hypothetical protein
VIWHIVRFDMGHLDDVERSQLEGALETLADLDEVRWLRVARDVDDPAVTGLITVFDDYEALERYRTHPQHVPVVKRIGDHGVTATRLDIATGDDPADLP